MTGLPEASKPVINVQLSSPIEEHTITKIFDPLNPSEEGSLINFRGVDTSVATIVVKVSDADIPLGSSAVHDVKPLSEIDVLSGVTKKVSDMDIAIVPDGDCDDSSSPVMVEAESTDEVFDEAKEVVEQVDSPEVVVDDDFQDAKSEEEESKPKDENDESGADTKEDDGEAGAGEESTKAEDGTTDDVGAEDPEGDAEEVIEADVSANTGDAETGESTEADATATPEDDGETAVDPGSNVEEAAAQEQTSEESTDVVSGSPPETTAAEETEAAVLVPTCVVQMRVEFNASIKDQKDELYDLLNKASKRKAAAVDKLRKSAAALNRSKPTSDSLAKKDTKAVKAGFLNKKPAKKEIFIVRWYNKTLGPNSLVRKVFPIAKNYILFFGGVALMHFQGQQLALPPPV